VSATRPSTEVVAGDCLDEASLEGAFSGVHTAYYLVHSMGAGNDFAALDRRAASNFGRAAARAGVRRIVYLGALSDDLRSLSTHLKSRAETGEAFAPAVCPWWNSGRRSSVAALVPRGAFAQKLLETAETTEGPFYPD
jgi:uncharacterized protein YbjT (DUF2867 family)